MGIKTYSSQDLSQNQSSELNRIKSMSFQCYFTPHVYILQKQQNSIQNSNQQNKNHYLNHKSFERQSNKIFGRIQSQDQGMNDNDLIRLGLQPQGSDPDQPPQNLQQIIQESTKKLNKLKNGDSVRNSQKKEAQEQALKYVIQFDDALQIVGDLIKTQNKLLKQPQTPSAIFSEKFQKQKVPKIDNQILLLKNLEDLIKQRTHKRFEIMEKNQKSKIENLDQKQDQIIKNQFQEKNEEAEFTIKHYQNEDLYKDAEEENVHEIEQIKNSYRDQADDEESIIYQNEIYFDQLLKTLEDPNVIKTVTKEFIQIIDNAIQGHPNANNYQGKILSIYENHAKANEKMNQDEDYLNEQKKKKEEIEKRMNELQEKINTMLENNTERVQYYIEQLWNQDEATQKILTNYADVLKKTKWISKTESIMVEKKDLLWKIQLDTKNMNEKNYTEQFSQQKTKNYEVTYSSYEKSIQKTKQNEVNQVRENVLENIQMYIGLPWNSDQISKDKFLKQKDIILSTDWYGKSYESLKDKKEALEAILKLIQKINKDNQYSNK